MRKGQDQQRKYQRTGVARHALWQPHPAQSVSSVSLVEGASPPDLQPSSSVPWTNSGPNQSCSRRATAFLALNVEVSIVLSTGSKEFGYNKPWSTCRGGSRVVGRKSVPCQCCLIRGIRGQLTYKDKPPKHDGEPRAHCPFLQRAVLVSRRSCGQAKRSLPRAPLLGRMQTLTRALNPD